MNPPSNAGPMLRGAFMKDARNWARGAYGPEAYQSALAKLSAEDRGVVEGLILPGSWYPIGAWDRFLDAMRAEAAARRGHSEAVFDMRNMREAGGSLVVKTVYKIVLGLVGPTTAIGRAAELYNRAYNEGRCEIVTNVRGRAVIRHAGASPAFRQNLAHHLPVVIAWVLEENGAPNAAVEITRNDIVDGKLVFEVTATYGAG